MAGERRFTRIPPESSGDRVAMGVSIEVPYVSANASFSQGDSVVFGASGFTGEVAFVRADSANAGIILVYPNAYTRENNILPTTGETIAAEGTNIALAANGSVEIYTPKYQLVSNDNQQHGQKVDSQGAAHMRFSEGPAQLDSFGKLRVSESTVVGDYTFAGGLGTYFTPVTATGGTVTHDSTAGHAIIATTTASGSSAYFTSDLWHHYFPGLSQLGLFSLYHGDAGKTNNVRKWGLFDEFNGVYFELNGTTVNVVVRSNISGGVVEQRFAQADWNVDKVNGAGGADNLSQFNLDITNINLYWIDYEWLGAGRIRWGVFSNGQRITCHVYNHATSSAWAKYGNYPVRFENENTGAAGSLSQMRVICTSVHTEGNIYPMSDHGKAIYATRSSMQVNSTPFYVGTIQTTANTHDAFILTDILTLAAEGGNSAAIELDYYVGPTLSGSSFSAIQNSNLEIDTSANVDSNGVLLSKGLMLGHKHNSLEGQSLQYSGYKSKANGQPFAVTVWATRVDGSTANCTFNMQMTFREIKNQYG